MHKLGILGNGFVGGTAYRAFSKLEEWDVRIHDKNPERSKNTLEEVCECEMIMVALPTPMILETGECFTGWVEDAIKSVREKTSNWIILRSTIPPGTTQKWHEKYGNVAFWLETLTEARPDDDFKECKMHIVGADESKKNLFLLRHLFWDAKREKVLDGGFIFTKPTTAELVKYTRNAYLATRLSFFKEIKMLSDVLKLDYEELSHLVGADDRIGVHYNKVNENTWGGHCLPKDLCALIYLIEDLYHFPGRRDFNETEAAKKFDINLLKDIDLPRLLQSVWDRNIIDKTDRDWEHLKGRAVISLEDLPDEYRKSD